MSTILRADLGHPALLEFRGPDAVRFLNGQLTQDVRLVVGGKRSLPSCVTDAKGRLQFRVSLLETADGAVWVAGPEGAGEELEARITRYLIADDVEVADFSGKWRLWHFTGPVPAPPEGVIAVESNRYGVAGTDWWVAGDVGLPENTVDDAEALEALRIANWFPAWGRELLEGMLPPEAGLDATDISYRKGCYIGQEVISRIKSAGKVNKLLSRFAVDSDVAISCGPLVDAEGRPAGELTSISPQVVDGVRHALGYAKRGADQWFFQAEDGTRAALRKE